MAIDKARVILQRKKKFSKREKGYGNNTEKFSDKVKTEKTFNITLSDICRREYIKVLSSACRFVFRAIRL